MEVYTLEEVAEKLKLPVQTLYKHIKAGKLRASKLGKHLRVTDEQLADYLKRHEVQPGDNIGDTEDTEE